MKLFILFISLINYSVIASNEKPTKCNDKKKVYKICDDQVKRFHKVKNQAKKENKILLIKFGAEWCSLCKSLHQLFKEDSFKIKFENLVVFSVGTYHYDKMIKMPDADKIFNMIKGKKDFVPEGVPFWGIYNPVNGEVYFQDTGVLEKSGKNQKGHSPNKVFRAIKKGIKKVSS